MEKRKNFETTGDVLAQALPASVKLVIEYECDIEHLDVVKLLDHLRGNGYAVIVSAEITHK